MPVTWGLQTEGSARNMKSLNIGDMLMDPILRLAALMVDAQRYEDAKKVLEAVRADAFLGLAQDRLGDLYAMQNQQAEAKAAYLKAFSSMEAASEYRRLVKVKLNALGVEPPGAPGAG